MILAASRLALRLTGKSYDRSRQCQDNVIGCGIVSSVWGMILQCRNTIKVSIELPVTTRHRRDITEKLLKATLTRTNNENTKDVPIIMELFIMIVYTQQICNISAYNIHVFETIVDQDQQKL